MDAPPTQYRVIERDGRLIVLDTRTNKPPKQAADMHPGREEDRTIERVSARDLMQEQASAKRQSERSGRSGAAMQSVPKSVGAPPPSSRKPKADAFERAMDAHFFGGSRGKSNNKSANQGVLQIIGSLFTLVIFLIIALSFGGPFGFFLAAVAIIIAGNSLLKFTGSKSGTG